MVNSSRMPSRRVIQSALQGFLGTLTSRYSAYEGRWLFGFLVDDVASETIDLLSPDVVQTRSRPYRTLIALAREKFRAQVGTTQLPMSAVRTATLELHRSAESRSVKDGALVRDAFDLTFLVLAVTDDGRSWRRERTVVVWRH